MSLMVQKLKEGDREVYRQIVEDRYTYFYKMACTYLQDNEVAKEVVQDVFFRLWEGRRELADDTVLDSYLSRMVKNRSIDYLRSRVVQVRNHEEYLIDMVHTIRMEESGLEQFSYEELSDRINKAIASLPDQMRTVFVMNRIEGMKYREISVKLGISQKTVEYHISRALRLLKEKLTNVD